MHVKVAEQERLVARHSARSMRPRCHVPVSTLQIRVRGRHPETAFAPCLHARAASVTPAAHPRVGTLAVHAGGAPAGGRMTFREALAEQRWDDHRYYHHNRINQSLHLVSALAFLASYALLFVSSAAAVLLAWLVAMPSRQIGHFFFEPHDYDHVNEATHEHKEAIKVGYNLRRKAVLLSIWGLSPLLLLLDQNLGGMFAPAR